MVSTGPLNGQHGAVKRLARNRQTVSTGPVTNEAAESARQRRRGSQSAEECRSEDTFYVSASDTMQWTGAVYSLKVHVQGQGQVKGKDLVFGLSTSDSGLSIAEGP